MICESLLRIPSICVACGSAAAEQSATLEITTAAPAHAKIEGNFSFGDKMATDVSKLYKAENLGSGTFIITKPKRKKIKLRQTELKNPRRGSRK